MHNSTKHQKYNCKRKKGSAIVEFGTAMFLLILSFIPLSALITAGAAYGSGLYLNYLQTRELSARRQADRVEALREIRSAWAHSVLGQLAGARTQDITEAAIYDNGTTPSVTVTTTIRGKVLFGGGATFTFTSSALREVRQ